MSDAGPTKVPGAVASEGRRAPGLEEMSATFARLSVEIEQGVAGFPDERRRRDAEVLFAGALFLDRLKPYMGEIRRMMAPKQTSAYHQKAPQP